MQEGLQRQYFTPVRMDPSGDPPAFVDVKLPTVSSAFRGPLRRGDVRAPRGTIIGSYRVTGSHYDNAPGTYALRVTRVSVYSGSRGNRWAIWHSRAGTYDIRHFEDPGQHDLLGGPDNPLYVFPPGSVLYGFIGNLAGSIGSAYLMSQFMEGHLNA